MYTGNKVTPVITKVCACEILLVVFFYLTCATKLHLKHVSITCIENYICDVINYIDIKIIHHLIQ